MAEIGALVRVKKIGSKMVLFFIPVLILFVR